MGNANAKSAKPKDGAQVEVEKWIKWASLLGAVGQKLTPALTTTRGLMQLPAGVMESLMKKKPGDHIFWASMSSTTMDSTISESYANQCKPVNKNVLFEIRNVHEGLELHKISAYPKEKEILFPPLALLRVVHVTPPITSPDPRPGRIVCSFVECLMTDSLQQAVFDDLAETTNKFRAKAQRACDCPSERDPCKKK